MKDVILLEGIQVPAALGVTTAERRARRPVLLDLEIEVDLRAAGASDRIGQTLHYKHIFEGWWRRSPGASSTSSSRPSASGSRAPCSRASRRMPSP